MTKLLGTSVITSFLALAVTLPVIAQTANTSTATSTAGRGSDVNLVCVQNAVSKRDTAVGSAFDAYYTAEKAALTSRTSALSSAWTITDRKARRTAIRTAWKNFQTASKSVQKTFRTAKKTAWDTFTTDRKVCGKGAASEDPTGRGIDDKIL